MRERLRLIVVIIKVTPNDEFFSGEAVKMPRGLMKRFVVGENDEFRSGLSKFTRRPDLSNAPLKPIWIDEFFVGIRGNGKITARSQPDYDKEEVFDINEGEVIFMSKGIMRRIEAMSDEWVFFYVAMPASSKGMGYKVLPSGLYDKRDVQALGTTAK